MPSAKAKDLKANLIKICHTLKRNKFPTDDNRKDYLYVTYGVESSKEMSIDQLREFAIYLGWNDRATKSKKTFAKKGQATQKQLDMMLGIWKKIARDKTEEALRKYIYRVIKVRPLYLSNLTVAQAVTVNIGLKKMQDEWREDDNNR